MLDRVVVIKMLVKLGHPLRLFLRFFLVTSRRRTHRVSIGMHQGSEFHIRMGSGKGGRGKFHIRMGSLIETLSNTLGKR